MNPIKNDLTCSTCGGDKQVRPPDPCSDEFHHGPREDGCVDCGEPLRGDVLRECASAGCAMYGGRVAR